MPPTSRGSTDGSPPAQSLLPTYLTDLDPVNETRAVAASVGWENKEVAIDGRTYQHGMTATDDCRDLIREYALNGRYRGFTPRWD